MGESDRTCDIAGGVRTSAVRPDWTYGSAYRPRADPGPGIDAYYWVKPPGESDGSSDSKGPRFDPMCAGKDAAPNAAQAGQWFESYFMGLVRNAKPPL